MPPYITSETARERKLYRYYQPSQAPSYGIDANPESAGRTDVPQSSHDTVLTAFAQLACLRLNTRRAMISLVDRQAEYIVAEATRTLSLQSDSTHHIGDGMLAGNRTIAKSEGLCWFAVDYFTTRINELMKSATATSRLLPAISQPYVVPDLAADERFNMKTFSARDARLAFYAGAPITAGKGFIIGAISVVDDKPRDGLSEAEQAFLVDLSKSIMEHLEMARVKQQQYRAEGMVKGIGLFVEGKSSLRDWWLLTGHESRGRQGKDGLRRGLTLSQQADEEYGTNHPIAKRSSTPSNREAPVAMSRDFTANSSLIPPQTRPLPPAMSDSWETNSSADSSNDLSLENPSAEEPAYRKPVIHVRQGSTASALQPPQLDNESAITESMKITRVVKEIGGMFSRASNLIREATAVEGVLFLDVGSGNYEGSTSSTDVRQKAPGPFNGECENWTTFSSDEDHRKAALLKSMTDTAEATAYKDQQKDAGAFAGDAGPQKVCKIFGWSTRSSSSLYQHRAAKEHSSVPERFLQKMLKRYPHGKVFNFDEQGSVSSSEEDLVLDSELLTDPADSRLISGRKRREAKQLRRKIEADTITSIFPGTRSVAFMPLWDPHKEKWYSCAFSWSLRPTRVFDDKEDLTYLAAFGNSIMAEVSRMNALIADQRKADLISTISHELRSPLHGVLASIEILKETDMDALQDSLVAAIDTCGRSLLDVINHVLDYTKGNNAKQTKRPDATLAELSNAAYPNPQLHLSGLPRSNVNLTVLTEEVVESIIAGRRYDTHHAVDTNKDGRGGAMATDSGFANALSAQSNSDPVMVILDFEWQQNWIVDIQPGAWKRVVMNLVANAMKYTDAGFVCVSLRCNDVPATEFHGAQSEVVLSVVDSGKGISDNFMRNQLFQPFSQEDSLTKGVGLGLSIIQKIVQSLGGTIEFTSELGTGTEAVVTLVMDKPVTIDALPLSSREQLIADVQTKIGHLKACLVGFDVFPKMSEAPTGIMSLEAERMLSLKCSLTRLLVEWFGVDVLFVSSPVDSPADIYITTESVFQTWPTQSPILGNNLPGQPGGPPLIVVGSVSASLAGSVCNSDQSISFVQEPCGPFKLAKALAFCLTLKERTSPVQGSHAESPAKQNSTEISNTEGLNLNEKTNNTLDSARLPTRRVSVLQRKGSRSKRNPALPVPVRQTSFNWSSADSSAMSPLSQSDITSPGWTPIDGLSRPHLLIVEDNEINMKLLVTYMRKLGHIFKTAENGLEALEAYKDSALRFCIILMDISMPIMDGLTSTRLIRAHERATNMAPATIIALTAAASQESRREAMESGVDIFLTKPVPMKELKGIISSWRPKALTISLVES